MSTNFYVKDEISVRHIGKLVMIAVADAPTLMGDPPLRRHFLWATHPVGLCASMLRSGRAANAVRANPDGPQDYPIIEDEYGRGMTYADFVWTIVDVVQDYSQIGTEFS